MSDQSSRFAVRSADVADVVAIGALDDLSPSTRRLLADDLASIDRRTAVVAVGRDAVVVGFAMATRQADAAHVLDVVVDPAWRRRGVATQLLAHLAREAVAAGTPALTLEVRASNRGARLLYESLGFEDAGVRPGYYQDGEDAHVLWHHAPGMLA